MLSNGTSQRHRLRLRVAAERLIADVVGGFRRRFLRRKPHGFSLHHSQGVQATVAPALCQPQRTHIEALPLTGGESPMAFLALSIAP